MCSCLRAGELIGRTMRRVLAVVLSAVEDAAASVGLPAPIPYPDPLDAVQLCAFIPVMDASHCFFVAVSCEDSAPLCQAAGADVTDGADLIAEMTNVIAGIVVAGTEFALGLPVVVSGMPVMAPPADERVFSIAGTKIAVGTWG